MFSAPVFMVNFNVDPARVVNSVLEFHLTLTSIGY